MRPSPTGRSALLTAVLALLLSGLTTPAGAVAASQRSTDSWQLTSPGGVLTVEVTRDPTDGRLSLAVTNDHGLAVASRLGVRTAEDDLTRGLEPTGARRRQVEVSYDTVTGKRLEHHDVANELTLSFEAPSGRQLAVQVRAFDDGIGYRYLLPGSGPTTVTGEASEFRVPATSDGWLMEYRSNYENQYQHVPVADVEQVPYAFPALFRTPGGGYTLLSESDVDGRYAASHLTPSGPGRFAVTLPEDSVTSDGPLQTPWRVAMVGDLSTVVESDLVSDLASPSRLSDTSWVRPGTVAWSWWSDGGSPRSFERQKDYVDHAAEEGWEYVLVDEGWSPDWMPELVDYARSKGVGVLVWARWDDLETQAQRDRLLPLWKSWGVAGVKLDFMNSDTQERMKWYDAVLRDTAEQHLMVNFHGATVPHGIERTWPHVLTSEAVRGAEDYHLGWVTPEHNVNLALSRNVVGSMDYTPITFSAERRETSAGHELALSVVFESGWLHPADSVETYDSRGVAEAVLRRMPTVWDQTELVSGTPGRAATFARRSGDRWFVGSAHAGAPGTDTLPLRFLDSSRDYTATVVSDRGHDDLAVHNQQVTSADTLSIDTARNGGYVVLLCGAGSDSCLDENLLSRVDVDADRRWPAAGSEDTVTVGVADRGSRQLRDLQVRLSASDGWSAEPVGPRDTTVPPGGAASYQWRLQVPADAEPGSKHQVRADVTYTAGGETVQRTGVLTVTVAPGSPPTGSPYLSDVDFYSSFNWVGPLERDQSNGGSAEGDGGPLTIEGRVFDKGLGGHAHSEQVLYLGGGCDRLSGYVGVDDAVGDAGSVEFHVWGDDRLLYDSGPMSGEDPARTLDADLHGVEYLRPVMVDGGDFVGDDVGDWAGARLSC